MKIGFSFGRCVRDIVDGVVNIDDVLLVVGRTRMPDRDSCKWVIDSYLTSHYLRGRNPEKCLEVGLALYDTCRVIEPRSVAGGHAMQVPSDCVWMDLFPTVTEVPNDSVRAAWEQYRMLIGLTAQLPEIDEQALMHHKADPIPTNTLDTLPKKRGRKSKAQKEAEIESKKALDLLAAFIV
jgi:hypothetical protein